MKLRCLVVVALAFSTFGLQAQEKNELIDWHLRDLTSNERGINVEKAYTELLNGKQPKAKVIVAVIDSGVDIKHEDLADVIWTNKGEIADNGIDDDNNGYIDDVHGWNFLGGADGSMVYEDNLEIARLYKKYDTKYAGKKTSELSKAELLEWKEYQRIKNELEEERAKADRNLNRYKQIRDFYDMSKQAISKELGKEDFTLDEVKAIEAKGPEMGQAQAFWISLAENGASEKELNAWGDQVTTSAEWYYNPDVESRKNIIKDDPNNPYEKGYGNNKSWGVKPDHGTHVAGIIAAVRNNNIGMNGVANNVLIMPIRTVPKGDEHDKDVAQSIRYAVDNGARVINMSFGKSFSAQEKLVAEAIQYAEDNGVLLVHAAGNDSNDLDVESNFPTVKSEHIKGKVSTFITVGASSVHADEKFPAEFSNYGDKSVDVFAPGVDIYSATPNNEYEFNNGTSMASPVVAGLATSFDDQKVNLPGTGGVNEEGVETPATKVEFGDMSKTAGLVNAYEALKLADKKSKY